jgi:hypothetical protein
MLHDAAATNPYAPPAPTPATSAGGASPYLGKRLGVRALQLLLGSVAVFGVTIAAGSAGAPNRAAAIGFAVASTLAGLGALLGLVSAVASRSGQTTVAFRVAVVLLGVISNGGMALLGALAAFLSTAQFSRGRQLRSFGRVLLARVDAAGDWAALPFQVAVDDSARTMLAAQWRENGRTEHASVAAFARLTLDLMALGAPPWLVAAANRDALDEVRHTELCFSLARAIDGKSESPGPFPEAKAARTLARGRTFALAGLAVDSLIDGALHEGVSARVVARLARRCDDPSIRAVLKEIAADEGRHAAHGWDVVAWCLAEGGTPVAHTLAGALAALPTEMKTTLPGPAAAGQWEKYGIVGRVLEAEELAKARADLVRRVEGMIAGASAAA